MKLFVAVLLVFIIEGLAEKMLEKGIRVNCVVPGPVWTPLVIASNSEDENAVFGANVSSRKTILGLSKI